MNSRLSKGFLTFVAMGLAGSVALAKPSGTTLLVIPSRYTVVQFCFDIARIRSVYLVAYDQPATVQQPLLYAWNNDQSNWIPIKSADLGSGSLFTVPPVRTVLVGGGAMLPANVAAAVSQAGAFSQVESLNLMDLANALHQSMRFTSSEWKWLAGRYGLQLKDRNEDRRRWGRYGPPGQEGADRTPSAGREFGMDPEAEDIVIMPPPPAEAEAAPARQTLVIPPAGAASSAGDGAPSVGMWDAAPGAVPTPMAEKGVSDVVAEAAPVVAAETPAVEAAPPAMLPQDK